MRAFHWQYARETTAVYVGDPYVGVLGCGSPEHVRQYARIPKIPWRLGCSTEVAGVL